MDHYRYARIESSTTGKVVIDLFDPTLRFPFDGVSSIEHDSVVQYSIVESTCVVHDVVATANTALAALWHVLADYEVVPYFPASVSDEVQSIVNDPGIDDDSIEDLTDLPFITIDNVDSRDLDQAMHIESVGAGYTLHYALADAAYFVKPGSALFNEALRRGSSYYLPGFSVPMLPPVLSEGLVSLNPLVMRRALVFVIRFDQQGKVLETSVLQARIQSVAKLSYSGVESYYINPGESELKDQSYTPTLNALRDLGQLRISEARRRNVVDYNRSSVEVSLSEDGDTFDIYDSDRLQVEKYNEQISLVCNAEGARLLKSANLPRVVQGIFRVHDAPEEERLKKFSRLLRGLIKHYKLAPELWVWRWRDGKYGKREYLADYIDRLKANQVDPGLLSAVQQHSLMLSPASRFTTESDGHHSLKLQQYARFSSPMREIAGVYTHREYLQLLAHPSEPADTNDLELREAVINAANRAKEIQKKLNKAVMKFAIDQMFNGELELDTSERKVWPGTVMSLRSTRVYVKLDSPAITVKVYLRTLSKLNGVKYSLDKSSALVVGDDGRLLALGQKVQLRVENYSADDRKWTLLPIQLLNDGEAK